ncbi:hypothetical protein PENTCL1PPCAC_13506, partial [Pristionchus entomophagus]
DCCSSLIMHRIILLTLSCAAAFAVAQSTRSLLNPCMTVKCVAGKVCETTREGTAQCVELTVAPALEPIPVMLNACAATSCPIGAVCVEEKGVGKCVKQVIPLITCENTDCVSGKVCEMKKGKP